VIEDCDPLFRRRQVEIARHGSSGLSGAHFLARILVASIVSRPSGR